MDVFQVFHMNGGAGDYSYAKNCTVQSEILSITKPFVEAAIHDYLSANSTTDTVTFAELGCSSGSTALTAVSEIMDVVEARHRKAKFMVYLVDLPSNDFNEVFGLLPSFHKKLRKEKGSDFGPCFIAGLPGNFYERLFPSNTLNFVHSSSSLHWLSQVPQGLDGKDDPRMLNKKKIYISKTSTREVIDAYRMQFRNDFMNFLKHRSQEVVSGGRMVLAFMGRKSIELTSLQDSYPFEFIAQALMTMVSEGLIEEEKVDSLNVPFYAPSFEEVKQLIEEESSFYVDRLESVEIEWDGGRTTTTELDSFETRPTRGAMTAKMHRAATESVLEHHFGGEILDELFIRYGKILDDHILSNGNTKFVNLIISLIKS
ncbi:hypothetical protein RND81_01G177800 [Saponaria officinalis]|uniref:Uncharacterized protein n=1 Tax=Saponaria officinalis TaxID=3572 RepID=A0AAW1NAN2_SAPOF